MAGTVITTGSHPRLNWPGVHATWGQEYASHPPEHQDLYEIMDSDKALEIDVEITGFGLAPVKPQGGAGTFQGEVQGIESRYPHIAYALGWIVTYEELRDNLYPVVATRRARGNAFSMAQTVENVAAFLYNNAFATTYFTTGDGVALCSASHVNALGGTYSNVLSPAADLSEAALEDLTVQIMLAQTGVGLQFASVPQSLHVSAYEWYNANRILGSVLQSDTSNNNINVLKATNAFPKGIKMNHYFTNAKPWFVRTNVPNGMTMFWRDRPDMQKDNEFQTRNAMALSYMRFSVGCTDPRGIYGVNAV